MSVHPDDAAAYISFLEGEVEAATRLAHQIGETLRDDHRLCTLGLRTNALLWLDGIHWN